MVHFWRRGILGKDFFPECFLLRFLRVARKTIRQWRCIPKLKDLLKNFKSAVVLTFSSKSNIQTRILWNKEKECEFVWKGAHLLHFCLKVMEFGASKDPGVIQLWGFQFSRNEVVIPVATESQRQTWLSLQGNSVNLEGFLHTHYYIWKQILLSQMSNVPQFLKWHCQKPLLIAVAALGCAPDPQAFSLLSTRQIPLEHQGSKAWTASLAILWWWKGDLGKKGDLSCLQVVRDSDCPSLAWPYSSEGISTTNNEQKFSKRIILVNICLLLLKPPANFGKTSLSGITKTWRPFWVLRTFSPCFLVVYLPLCLPSVSMWGQDGD